MPCKLEPGPGELRELAAGGVHDCRIGLKAGWLLHLSIEQQGVDVRARVLAPDGAELFRVDSPSGTRGAEEVWLVAKQAGEHRIRVEGVEKQGSYRARVAELRPATVADQRNAAAEKAFYQAKALEKADASRKRLERMYLEAAGVWAALSKPLREGDAWDRIGRLRSKTEDRRGALDAHRRSRSLYHQAGAHRQEAVALRNMAELLETSSKLEDARLAWIESMPLWAAVNEPLQEAGTAYRLCQIAHLRGRVREALECYDLSFKRWKSLRQPTRQAVTRIDAGTLYTSLGDFNRALESYRVALSLLTGPEAAAPRSATLTQLGNAYLRAGAPHRALPQFQNALTLAKGDPGGQAAALNGMGLAWQQAGRLDQADLPLRRALAIFDQLGDLWGQATVWSNLGWLRLAEHQPLPALEAFQQALEWSAASGNRGTRAMALSGMARAERQRGNWIAARDRMERALEVIEAIRADAGWPSEADTRRTEGGFLVDLLKASYLASKQDDYAFLIDLLMERGDDAAALQVSERARARSLSDNLTSADKTPVALSLEEIQSAVLDEGSVLLEYSLGEDRSFLWWVTRNGHRSFELPGRAVLEPAVRRLHELIRRGHRPEARSAARRKAAELSRLLLGPVAGLLGKDRLLIVAPELLQYVPFEALPDPSGGPAGPRWPAPLLARHQVVCIPSASVLARLRRQRAGRKRPPGLLALVGDPVSSDVDSRLPLGAQSAGGDEGRLTRLAHAGEEIEAIAALVQGEEILTATGFDATRDLVLRGVLRRYTILHFAAHGLLDAERPERSALLLSRFDRRGRPREGRLTAEDIHGLDLPVDLVVLSACETALGQEVRGEGLVGLTHSFLSAGASSVVVSLWSVDDRATAVLMERFYRELLKGGRPPAEALRAAQLSLWRDPRWGSPYYWGAFVLEGEWLNKTRSPGSP